MGLDIPFDNAYARLPERFYSRVEPEPVAAPEIVLLNDALARDLGLDPSALRTAAGAAFLSGNAVPDGAAPLAQVYAGHQFGGWSPRLGDGRAVLLGEVVDASGARRDIQLKGSGRTPYSRMGDGRAWIGPVLREYVVSEAMHALGIPTTRALAAVATGQPVQRERALPGAVLTRVASSHVRVGTFQYFAARRDAEAIRALAGFAIGRHYPEAETPLGLLDGAVAAQARLVARWMGVGFVHGVMNTDNCHVGGETIDYGPCAFMDAYHPDTVFSSIDRFGRYAYARQPDIAAWNLAQLASALLPAIDDDQDRAVELATASVRRFAGLFRDEWLGVFRAKLGLATGREEDGRLVEGLLAAMARGGADFTNTFRGLADGTARGQFREPAEFDAWAEAWEARRAGEPGSRELMERANPAVIPRNHRIEEAIRDAVEGRLGRVRTLVEALGAPFALRPGHEELAAPPGPGEAVLQTFCGT